MKAHTVTSHLFPAFFSVFLLQAASAQNPEGPQQPEMPDRQPEIVIRSSEGLRVVPSEEDPDKTVVVYAGDVVLQHFGQNLDLRCDRLELYFDDASASAPAVPVEEAAEAASKVAEGDGAAAAEGAAKLGGGGQIDKIIAIGNVEIVKIGDDGVPNIARAGHAEYFPDVGTVVLTEAPQIQDDTRWVRATGQEGVIMLREDGQHSAEGGEFETVLLDGAGKGGNQ